MAYQEISSRENQRKSSIEKPQVYSPSSYPYNNNTVKPVTFAEEVEYRPDRRFLTIVIIGAIVGFISGFVLLMIDSNTGLLRQVSGSVAAHCLIYGTLIGALTGVCISPLYLNLRNALPAYALLLFIPTILFLLTSPLTMLSSGLLALGKFLLSALGVVVVVGIIWMWLS